VALTLIVEQRLGDAGLVKFFDAHRNAWKALAKKTYVFLEGNFPAGSEIRRDDVAKGLRSPKWMKDFELNCIKASLRRSIGLHTSQT
jgi:hypothetical protein